MCFVYFMEGVGATQPFLLSVQSLPMTGAQVLLYFSHGITLCYVLWLRAKDGGMSGGQQKTPQLCFMWVLILNK